MYRVIPLALCASLLTPALAQEGDTPNLDSLRAVLGAQEISGVLETPVDGLYEVRVGAQIFYLSEDGRYAMQGDLIDLENRDNLTEVARNDLRAGQMGELSESDMVIFGPESAPYTVTIFTDIDCGYCRKLHQEIDSYADLGIRVRYLAFPRAGAGSESFDKAVSVWCADDPNDAMTRAKLGENIASATCPNPVAEQYQLGQTMGVRGTPSIILDNGQMVPGYVPADQLLGVLEEALGG